MKTIFHVDMDAFFVSVEELYDPSLRGKPVVVGGSSEQRGVVSAASYAARKFGVHSAMPLRTAHQLCPQAIFVEGHPDRYRKYSNLVREVLGRFTPQVEMASIDEAYLDMTGTERLHGPPLLAAHKLHNAIREATGLNNSIGAGTSRLLAKVCSDQAKPHGIVWIPPGAEAAFLAPLAVRKIPGVGKVTEQKLHRLGIRQVGDLAALDAKFLAEHLGEWGLALAGKSKGLDAGGWFQGEIGAEQNPKSISHEHTFSVDTADSEALEAALAHLSEKVGRRLREHGLWARTIQLKLRYSDFSTFTRALTLGHATQIDTEIYQTARELLRKNRRAGAAIRLLGVQTSGLSPEAGQLDLLEGAQQERMGRALSAMDKLRDKYGEGSVSLALGLQGRFKERTHEALPNAPDQTGKPKK
ncbi:MAG: DNA polymerase IV [Acidobacteriota bacterium]|nr:DNA polymerase IV [Bryobacteraceae bacterium CoA2 C42]MCA2963141.1 DNA polymerase IV [Acidobacteriaceae bacterium]